METMWAPWRIEYILAEKEKGCVFCRALETQADLTLYTDKDVLVVMNKFPYTNAHLLVAPARHVAGLEKLGRDEMGQLLYMVDRSMAILKETIRPDGFNVGMNLGKVAGAGIEEHIHFHIVPRWFGDVNALAVFADVRVIPEHIRATYDKLKPYFGNMKQ
ncbi:MAG: HIT domain-containing protein [Desulfobacterales bacterium]|nr:HIT domain-containing protein [Desulfobacterales bacterium]